MQYCEEKEQIEEPLINKIQWEVFSSTMKWTQRSRQHILSKHVVGMCGVGIDWGREQIQYGQIPYYINFWGYHVQSIKL